MQLVILLEKLDGLLRQIIEWYAYSGKVHVW